MATVLNSANVHFHPHRCIYETALPWAFPHAFWARGKYRALELTPLCRKVLLTLEVTEKYTF